MGLDARAGPAPTGRGLTRHTARTDVARRREHHPRVAANPATGQPDSAPPARPCRVRRPHRRGRTAARRRRTPMWSAAACRPAWPRSHSSKSASTADFSTNACDWMPPRNTSAVWGAEPDERRSSTGTPASRRSRRWCRPVFQATTSGAFSKLRHSLGPRQKLGVIAAVPQDHQIGSQACRGRPRPTSARAVRACATQRPDRRRHRPRNRPAQSGDGECRGGPTSCGLHACG